MTLSRANEKILNENLIPNKMIVISRDAFKKSIRSKDLAFYCYHNKIFFYWTVNNFYFLKEEILND